MCSAWARCWCSPPPVTDRSGPVRPLVERCMAKDPGQRPTAAQFLAELRAAHPSAADLADWLPASILPAAASPPATTGHAALAQTITGTVTSAEKARSPVQPAGASGRAAGKRRRRRWAASGIAVVVVFGAAAVGLAVVPRHSTASASLRPATRPGTPATSCRAFGPGDGHTKIVAWKSRQDVECVGYSDSGFVFTNYARGEAPLQALQDERLRFDQQQVFQLNQSADQAH